MDQHLISLCKKRENEGREYFVSIKAKDKGKSKGGISLILVVNEDSNKIIQSYSLLNYNQPLWDTDEFVQTFTKALLEQEGFTFQIQNEGKDSLDLENDLGVVMILYNKVKKPLSTLMFQKIAMSEAFPLCFNETFNLQSEAKEMSANNLSLQKTNTELQSTLKKLTVEKNLMEDSLYRAFMKCVNLKKAKIKELMQKLDSKSSTTAHGSSENAVGRNINNKTNSPKKDYKKIIRKYSESESDSDEDSGSDSLMRGGNEELYNVETDTEEDNEIEKVKVVKKSNSKVKSPIGIGSSSSSGTETDFSFDEDNPNPESKNNSSTKQEPSTTSTVLIQNEENQSNKRLIQSNVNDDDENKRSKLEESIPDKYDKDALLDDL